MCAVRLCHNNQALPDCPAKTALSDCRGTQNAHTHTQTAQSPFSQLASSIRFKNSNGSNDQQTSFTFFLSFLLPFSFSLLLLLNYLMSFCTTATAQLSPPHPRLSSSGRPAGRQTYCCTVNQHSSVASTAARQHRKRKLTKIKQAVVAKAAALLELQELVLSSHQSRNWKGMI